MHAETSIEGLKNARPAARLPHAGDLQQATGEKQKCVGEAIQKFREAIQRRQSEKRLGFGTKIRRTDASRVLQEQFLKLGKKPYLTRGLYSRKYEVTTPKAIVLP